MNAIDGRLFGVATQALSHSNLVAFDGFHAVDAVDVAAPVDWAAFSAAEAALQEQPWSDALPVPAYGSPAHASCGSPAFSDYSAGHYDGIHTSMDLLRARRKPESPHDVGWLNLHQGVLARGPKARHSLRRVTSWSNNTRSPSRAKGRDSDPSRIFRDLHVSKRRGCFAPMDTSTGGDLEEDHPMGNGEDGDGVGDDFDAGVVDEAGDTPMVSTDTLYKFASLRRSRRWQSCSNLDDLAAAM